MHRGRQGTAMIQTFVALLLVVLLCQGCATVRTALAGRERGAPPWPPPPAEQAQFYLFRTAGTAPTVFTEMHLDGEPLEGEVTASALVLVVAPGPHVLRAGPAADRAILTVIAQAGRTYVVRVSPPGGSTFGDVGLDVFDEEAGRDAIDAAARASRGTRP
jgi:hypothetical protein